MRELLSYGIWVVALISVHSCFKIKFQLFTNKMCQQEERKPRKMGIAGLGQQRVLLTVLHAVINPSSSKETAAKLPVV